MTPTPEQELILAEARTPNSLLISALAGAAKTSTLCLLAAKLPLVPTLCCAFNKRIADEMSKRMPSHITCKTMNALGHAVWGQKLGRRLTVQADKTYTHVKEMMDASAGEEKKLFGEAFSSLTRGVRLAKSSGYVPDSVSSLGTGLTDLDDLLDTLSAQIDVEPDDWYTSKLIALLERSIKEAFDGVIDFDDQIYMSALFGGKFPKFPIIMVDEAQDLSPLNHQMLRKMFDGRMIAVGDPYQAIYAFRGALSTSMALLQEEFSMKEFQLSVSFRCPKAIVERARWRAPHMQFPDWAEEGLVKGLQDWGASDIPDGAAIICRNNAPLFSTALRLIRAGRGVKLIGNDVGANLVKVLAKLGDEKLPQTTVLGLIKDWEDAQLRKAREARKASIRDRAECLRVFADFGATLGESLAYARHLFECSGPIQLMSGHKSKGLEFDTVFHLDPHLIPSHHARKLADLGDESALTQERNLRYVIETRSKKELFFVSTENFQ